MKPVALLEYLHSPDDERFDLAFPPAVRSLSAAHWTPVAVARKAAAFLVSRPGTRVLDVGCGPGKFCLVGALTTPGRFTGIEQRRELCALAREIVGQAGLVPVSILHGNILDVDFADYDAFYLYNPFEEQVEAAMAIDQTLPLDESRYRNYVRHVAQQLARAPVGTRVATYFGACEEVPPGYQCREVAFTASLKLWEKTEIPGDSGSG